VLSGLPAVKMMIREHEFVDDVCRWCGGHRRQFFERVLTCVPRLVEEPPRSTPTSIFNDLSAIGERMREIQAEEQADAPPVTSKI
jgi:hypothetical protein